MTYRIFYNTGNTVEMIETAKRPTWTLLLGRRWLEVGDNKVIPETHLRDVTDEHGELIDI